MGEVAAWRSAKRATGVASRPAEGMAALVSPAAAFGALAAPDEGRWIGIPAADGGSQPVHQLVGIRGVLAGQGPADQDALDRFGQVEPRAGDRGIQRQDALLQAPADQRRRAMPPQVVPDQQQAQRRELTPVEPEGRPVQQVQGIGPVRPAVADGASFTAAAQRAGRRSGDGVAKLVARFNRLGLAAVETQHGHAGPPVVYGPEARERILREFRRVPDREQDGTATWSLTTLQRALRRAPDGLPTVSTATLLATLWQAGYTWQRDRPWCATGTALRRRRDGTGRRSVDSAAPQKRR